MDHSRLEPDKCPICNYVMDAATCISDQDAGKKPQEGDVTFCLKCASILVFDWNLKVQIPTRDFFESLSCEDIYRFARTQALIRQENVKRN